MVFFKDLNIEQAVTVIKSEHLAGLFMVQSPAKTHLFWVFMPSGLEYRLLLHLAIIVYLPFQHHPQLC